MSPNTPARLLCLLLPLAGQAQEATPTPPEPASLQRSLNLLLAQADRLPALPAALDLGGDNAAFAAGELAAGRVVKGAPYCADAVHETVQWLPDPQGGAANRIVRQQTSRLCRDGEGRTRQEVERDGRKRVYLRDPVAGESWVLDPASRSVRRLGGPVVIGNRSGGHPDAAAWRDYADRMRDWARQMADRVRSSTPLPAPPAPVAPPAPSTGAAVAPPAPAAPVLLHGGETVRSDVQVRVLRHDAAAGEAPLPPGLSLRAAGLAPRGPGVTTALPAKDIDGLRVDGERTTWTIEAGRIGNDKPIVISREVWRSPELLLTVQTRDIDPRSGETGYRLSNLKRGEPDAALMKVPADYQLPAPKGQGAASSRATG
ncbi:MAG: hypothetical protein KBC73_02005 [Burkholderiaceae bacterium]|nr:hypothetical protein [Burkholderiaceae bacterium]